MPSLQGSNGSQGMHIANVYLFTQPAITIKKLHPRSLSFKRNRRVATIPLDWHASKSYTVTSFGAFRMTALSDYDKEWCTKIHAELLKWPLTSPFRVPVDPVRDNAPTYFQVVSTPMDLTTMKRKLADGSYKSANEFVDDFYLICDNAIKFNGENSMYAFIAQDLRNWITEQYRNKPSSSEDEWHRKLTDVVDRLREHVQNAPPTFRGLSLTDMDEAQPL
jgi:hypothetical protein